MEASHCSTSRASALFFCTSIASLPQKQRFEPGWTLDWYPPFFGAIAHRSLSGARTGQVDFGVFHHAVHAHNSFRSHPRRHSVHINSGNSCTSIDVYGVILSFRQHRNMYPVPYSFLYPHGGEDKKEEKLDFSSFSVVGKKRQFDTNVTAVTFLRER